MLPVVKSTIETDMTMNVIVADVELGGEDSDPRSHVERIPPSSAMTKATATAVARRACGALLFVSHVFCAGTVQNAPVTEKKREI